MRRERITKPLLAIIQATVEVYYALQVATGDAHRANPKLVSKKLETLARTVVQCTCGTPPGEWGGDITPQSLTDQVMATAETVGVSLEASDISRIVHGYDGADKTVSSDNALGFDPPPF